MRLRLLIASAVVWLAANLLAGCAVTTGAVAVNKPEIPSWRGRLALQFDTGAAGSESAVPGFSAEFELTGSPVTGELTFYTPLGSTAVSISWSPGMALLHTNQGVRRFESLNALIEQTIGTDLPVAALFAWLAGEPRSMAGWSADLSQFADGRISARRTEPGPVANLRLVLER